LSIAGDFIEYTSYLLTVIELPLIPVILLADQTLLKKIIKHHYKIQAQEKGKRKARGKMALSYQVDVTTDEY
jgi:hypothetical protein